MFFRVTKGLREVPEPGGPLRRLVGVDKYGVYFYLAFERMQDKNLPNVLGVTKGL